MGKIVRNGVEFSGAADDAENIGYDSSETGFRLSSDNVQDATLTVTRTA